MNYEWGDWRVCNFFQWFFLRRWCKLEIDEKEEMHHLQQKDVSPPAALPSSHQNALSRALKLKLQTASWSLGRPSTHHTPSTCYQARYVLPFNHKMANDEADRDIDDCFLVPCSLCKGLGSCKVFWVKMVKTLRAQFPSHFHQPTTCFSKSGRHHMSTVEMR